VNTDITEHIKGWVFYDAECPLCRGWAERSHGVLAKRGWHFVPLQAQWARLQLGLAENAPLLEMKLLTADGRIFGGADALIQLARAIRWAWPAFALAQLPGVKWALSRGYARLAARRHCAGERCNISKLEVKSSHAVASAFYEIP
jgi:predicted DCC family thiol-disulfide oxidoreductase YuxK